MNWNLPEIKGTKEVAQQKVSGAKDGKSNIPEHVKAYITAELGDMPPDVSIIAKVTGYSQDAINESASTVTRNINITIVGVRL